MSFLTLRNIRSGKSKGERKALKKQKGAGLLSYDGKLIGLLNKMGEIILLDMVFLICCLPVATIGPALTSLYYATMKSIRRERGYPLREFCSSMKRTLARGVLLTAVCLLWLRALFFGRNYFLAADGQQTPMSVLYSFLIFVSTCIILYLFPVFSRFDMKLTQILKLSFVMSIRFLPLTILDLAGTALIGWVLVYFLPIPCFFFVPGLWCLALTFPMEKAMRAYMPKADTGEEQWYDK